MMKHIMRKCKVVNDVDKETSMEHRSHRSSTTTCARLHRACPMARHNTNLEELTKIFPERDEEQWMKLKLTKTRECRR